MVKKNELNIINVLLCFAVIFIHAAGSVVFVPNGSVGYCTIFPLWNLASVAVPGFIFLSGVKVALSKAMTGEEKYGKYMLKKTKNIYFPYVFWVVIYYLYFVYSRGFFSFSWTELLEYIALGDVSAHFYFVVIIMQFYLLLPLWKKVLEKMNPVVFLFLTVFITILCNQYLRMIAGSLTEGRISFRWNDRLFTSYVFYYALGLVTGKYYENVLCIIRKNKSAILVFTACIAVAFCGLYMFSQIKSEPMLYECLESFKLAYCTGAIFALLLISDFLKRYKFFKGKFFKLMNYSTYHVYLVHLLIMQEVDRILWENGILDRRLVSFGIRIVTMTVLTFALCMLYNKFKQKITKKLNA